MKNKLTIICDGDSWVFGCEIVDPKISKKYNKNVHPGEYDHLEENDEYRLSRIFPTHLSNLLDANVINLSWPADDNTTILNRTISYISTNYLSKGLSTDNILVIVGWSSPERNSFWYKDDKISSKFQLWPNVNNFNTKEQGDFWKLYVEYLWNPEEYLTRYVMNVLQFQNFCDANNIKWLCFNSFYQTPNKNISEWEDLNIYKELKNLNLSATPYNESNKNNRSVYTYEFNSIWKLINNVNFYKKDLLNNTFKSFIDINNLEESYNGWHPSPKSHKLWAEELSNYIKKNNII